MTDQLEPDGTWEGEDMDDAADAAWAKRMATSLSTSGGAIKQGWLEDYQKANHPPSEAVTELSEFLKGLDQKGGPGLLFPAHDPHAGRTAGHTVVLYGLDEDAVVSKACELRDLRGILEIVENTDLLPFGPDDRRAQRQEAVDPEACQQPMQLLRGTRHACSSHSDWRTTLPGYVSEGIL